MGLPRSTASGARVPNACVPRTPVVPRPVSRGRDAPGSAQPRSHRHGAHPGGQGQAGQPFLHLEYPQPQRAQAPATLALLGAGTPGQTHTMVPLGSARYVGRKLWGKKTCQVFKCIQDVRPRLFLLRKNVFPRGRSAFKKFTAMAMWRPPCDSQKFQLGSSVRWRKRMESSSAFFNDSCFHRCGVPTLTESFTYHSRFSQIIPVSWGGSITT